MLNLLIDKFGRQPQHSDKLGWTGKVVDGRSFQRGRDVSQISAGFRFGGFLLDRSAGGLFRLDGHGGRVLVMLGSRAVEVLGVLVKRQGELVPKQAIMDAVWPDTAVEDNNLTVQISALRRVLDQGRTDGSCIQTIPGRGYRFVAAVPVPAAPEGDLTSNVTGVQVNSPHRSNGIAERDSDVETLPTSSPPSRASISVPGTPPRLSIVVLPFANWSNDPEQQYFADAIAEDLTADLSRLAGMLVISRNSAFTYKDKRVDTKQIRRELGVRYVLEGSVQRSGSRVRVSARLIDTETDAHLWAERFVGDTGDLFALQDDITRRIAIALTVELIGAEASRPTEHPDALDCILRGRALVSQRLPTRDTRAAAIKLFEQALALDPDSVEAQALVAINLAGMATDEMTDSAAADIARAERLAERAVTAWPRNARARTRSPRFGARSGDMRRQCLNTRQCSPSTEAKCFR